MTTYLAGVGMTPFGKFRDSTLASLGSQAGREALADAGVDPHAIEMIACGSARSGMLHARESGVGQLIGWDLGIEGVLRLLGGGIQYRAHGTGLGRP
jgi:3-oxoacyl-[acyl-carrier-protein] synthase III